MAGLIAPDALGGGTVTSLVRLYAGTYAVRAVPLAGAVLYLLARRTRTAGLAPLLVVAGLAQLGDAAIGVALGYPNMIAGGASLAAIHLASAGWLARAQPSPPGP